MRLILLQVVFISGFYFIFRYFSVPMIAIILGSIIGLIVQSLNYLNDKLEKKNDN